MPCLTDSAARDYVAGRLAAAAHDEARRHLDGCARCRAMLVVAGDVWSPASAAEQRDQPPAPSQPLGFPPPGMGIAARGRSLADLDPAATTEGAPDTDRLADGVVTPPPGPIDTLGPAPPPMPRGTSVGRYIILERLGAGGMSMVYSAYDAELDRKVALKFLHPGAEKLGDLGPVRLRLVREAQALARLSHPHVVSIYDVGTHEGEVFIAMELVEGQSLSQWLQERPRSWRELLVPFQQAGAALAAAHAAGLVHRDFKPSNVLIGTDGRARVVDFGLALPAAPGDATIPVLKLPPSERVSERDAVLTRVGLVLGTPAYMAPEQYLARPVDARTDQFSFGVALFEALYGQRPFPPGPDGSFGENVVNGRMIEPPRDRRVPTRLRRIVLRALSVRPEDRYASMDELLTALAPLPRAHVPWLVVAGAALVVALGVNASRFMPRRADLACADPRQRLAGVWDGERKQRIGEAVAAHGPTAAAAWRETVGALDTYVAAWSQSRREVCEATRRGRQTVEARDLRLRCLDWQLEEVRALAALLEGGDESVIARGHLMASRLSPQDQCGDLAAPARPPRGADAEPVPDVLRAQIIRARVLFHAGKLKDTIAAAREAAAAARTQGRRSVEAEALHVLGTALIYGGDLAAAEQALWASAAAAEAAGRDEAAANAWMELVYVLGTIGERTPARRALAERCAEQAAAFIDRMGGSERLQAKLDLRRGTVALSAGQYAAAQSHFERAARSLGTHAPRATLLSTALEGLGEALAQQGKLAAGAETLERARALAEQESGPDHPRLGFYLLDLAGVAAAQGRHDEALARARRALELTRKEGKAHFLAGDCLVRIGDSLAATGRWDEAIDHYRQAVAAYDQKPASARDPRRAGALVRLGAALRGKGRLAEAAAEQRRALPLLEEGLEAEHPDLAAGLHELGLTLLAQRKPKEAAPLLERGLAIRERAAVRPADVAATRFALARAVADPARAAQLAADARAALARAEGDTAARLAEMDAWIAGHPAPARPR
jgi:tetratricopeptide (TPR) repeat protein